MIRQSIDDLKRETISAVSYLYKIAPIIYIDKNGVILNSKDLKEYGYWATLRLGDMLPLDYMPEFGY